MNIYTRNGDLYILHASNGVLVYSKYTKSPDVWATDDESVPVKSIQVEVGEASYLNGEYIGITDRFL